MDYNEFSFDALFKCPEFEFYESQDFKKNYSELNRILEYNVKDTELREKIDRAADECIDNAHTDSFRYGFTFAVRQIKFMLKI